MCGLRRGRRLPAVAEPERLAERVWRQVKRLLREHLLEVRELAAALVKPELRARMAI